MRGSKNNLKRLVLFHKLKTARYDVIFLQETPHDAPGRIALYERMERV